MIRVARVGPWLVAALGAALTGVLAMFADREERLRDEHRFDELVAGLTHNIVEHLAAHREALLSTRAHMKTAHVDRASFGRYVAELNLVGRYKGFQGIGWSELVPKDRLAAHLEERRADDPAYKLWPPGERDPYTAIVLLEPRDERNLRAIGYDMYSEPTRRDAMDRAWRSGNPATSGRVVLVQEGGAADPGFLVYVPLYDAPDKLRGFVYSPFNARRFIEGVLAAAPRREIDLDVYDGEQVSERDALFRAIGAQPNEGPSRIRRIDAGGRTWTLRFAPRAGFHRKAPVRNAAWAVAFGAVATIALAASMRRLVEARLRAEDELRAREEFLTLAAHELKTPLTPLRLQVQALRRALGKDADPKIARKLQALQRSSERLTALVATLLESGEGGDASAAAPEAVDLAEIVRDVAARMEDTFVDAGCTVTLDADDAVVGHWDRVRIEQVATNLLSNAAKYGRASPVEIGVAEREGRARLTVRDHGIGIAEVDRARIFGKFERGVSARNYPGLGVGLWIVRRVVERLRGTIDVEPTPGGGATFVVQLPLG
ncbi:MAG: CHASE domain-containing protein [Deltaproteobacteria bacterium]|nr:CHASE domain-containing protein [Deltaproteobacteria bacterium]